MRINIIIIVNLGLQKMSSLENCKQELEIQRTARQLAELKLEKKSREMHEKNIFYQNAFRHLQQQQQQIIAQEKQASIGQLSSGIAHEINNSNAFVQSNLETMNCYIDEIYKVIGLMSKKIEKIDKKWLEEVINDNDLDFILKDAVILISESTQGTQRIQRIVKGLRYFANSGNEKKQFDINACVRHTVELVGHEIDDNIEYCEKFGILPDYKGLPTLLSLAIGNLIKNSVESNPISNQVTIRTYRVNDEILIVVEDDGIGIEKELHQCIFDPFHTNKDFHNGLGLTISQAIVRQHNGKITVDSSLKTGTKVCIHLPIHKA